MQALEGLATPLPAAAVFGNQNTTFPTNVSGTYRGNWMLQHPADQASILPLTEDAGTVACQLKAHPSNTEEVLDVEARHLLHVM